MKRSVFILAILSVFSAYPAFAEDCKLETYYEFGRKGSSGLVEEEDLTDEFDYSKYNVKFAQKLKEASYYVKYQYYNKDFDTLENLDNDFQYAGLSLDTPIYAKDDFLVKIGPDLEFKKKHYKDSANLNYDQVRAELPITFKKESDWTVKLTGGINYYDYTDAPTDQFKLNSRFDISKKLFDERLEVAAFYKLQYIERQKLANRFEKNYGGSFDIRIDSPLVKAFEAGFEEGMDNTIIYEEREDSYDFKFFNWYLKTKHSFFEKMKANVKYTDTTREYADFDHNFGGFGLENNWSLRALEAGDKTLDIKFTYYHKQFRYPYVDNSYSLHNNNITPEIEFEKKRDWKGALGSEIRFYDYPAKRTNDKIYYIFRASMEKYLLKESLLVGFDYRYTFKNFLHKLDIIENVFRLRANYKF